MDAAEQVRYLLSPEAIRAQCQRLYQLAERGNLEHFILKPERIESVTDYVQAHIESNYPDWKVPYHSRWRHFDPPRLQELDRRLALASREERARSKIELAIVSVLLDAGAGMAWRYREADGRLTKLSEGLASASFDLVLSGVLSSDPKQPLRVDPKGLAALTAQTLGRAFQVSETNPLHGFEGRLQLLQRLGQILPQHPTLFGPKEVRLGHLFDALQAEAVAGVLPARAILAKVLQGLGDIWPGRVSLGGVQLGDVWPHPLLPQADRGAGLVPFHKLSQWLSYSLVEVFEEAGIRVDGLDELTGLAEYRNGGLLVDLGLLELRDPAALTMAHPPGSTLVIEWRALTICLLDEIARRIRQRLGLSSAELPLVKVLQGGTWSAGRKIAARLREDGGPPLRLASDGTVF